jgi:hypothetical protein
MESDNHSHSKGKAMMWCKFVFYFFFINQVQQLCSGGSYTSEYDTDIMAVTAMMKCLFS